MMCCINSTQIALQTSLVLRIGFSEITEHDVMELVESQGEALSNEDQVRLLNRNEF